MIETLLIFAYMVLAGSMIYLAGGSRARDLLFVSVVFSLLLLLAGFRAESVGNDTANYHAIFREIAGVRDPSALSQRLEPGFIYFCRVLSLFSSDPRILIFASSAFFMATMGAFIYRHSGNAWLSCILFVGLRYYSLSMNVIRHAMAIAFVILSYDCLRHRRFVPFMLLVLAGALFHVTALAFLLAWPLSAARPSKRFFSVTGSLVVLLVARFEEFLEILLGVFSRFAYYLGSEYLEGGVKLAVIMNVIVFSLVLALGFLSKGWSEDAHGRASDSESIDWHIMTNMMIAGVSILLISIKFNLFDRVAAYFTVFSIVYLPNSIQQIRNRGWMVSILSVVALSSTVYACLIEYYRPDWNRIFPYQFSWGSIF